MQVRSLCLGRSPGGGHGNPLQNSCLESPMDRGSWRAMVRIVTKSQTQLKRFSTHAQNHCSAYLVLISSTKQKKE